MVAPSICKDFVCDTGKSKYSQIVDESTNVPRMKWMCISVRYFSKARGKIIINFLGIFLVEESSAQKLYEGFTCYLKNVGLNISNLLSIGTDGANNLCGKQKSLFAFLKRDIPNLLLIKCTCHSLHLCCSKASTKIRGRICRARTF